MYFDDSDREFEMLKIKTQSRNSIVHYTILYAGLVFAGFGGFSTSGVSDIESAIAVFLSFSAIIFSALALILTDEEFSILKINPMILYTRKMDAYMDPRFLFIFIFTFFLPIITVLYLNVRVVDSLCQWLLSRPFLLFLLMLDLVSVVIIILARIRLAARVEGDSER